MRAPVSEIQLAGNRVSDANKWLRLTPDWSRNWFLILRVTALQDWFGRRKTCRLGVWSFLWLGCLTVFGSLTPKDCISTPQSGQKDVIVLLSLGSIAIEYANAELSDGNRTSLGEPTMLLNAEMSSGRNEGLVAEVDIMLVTSDNEPVPAALSVLDNLVLVLSPSVPKNLVEFNGFRLLDLSSLGFIPLLLSRCGGRLRVLVACSSSAFSLAPFSTGQVLRISFSLWLDKLTHGIPLI